MAEPDDSRVPLTLTIGSIPVDLSVSPVCQETSSSFTDYVYTASSTPRIVAVSPAHATPGSLIELSLSGLSDIASDNVFLFGGHIRLTCTEYDPAFLSTTLNATNTATGSTYTEAVTIIQCRLPNDILPGNYRTLLHVSGRGWSNAVLEDTSIEIRPRIDSSPQIQSISLRGGVPITLQTSGLLPSSISSTRVLVGNTPCVVQSISDDGELTCLTQAAVDDGYSSLIDQNTPVGYWTLQTDLPGGETDGSWSFMNKGSIGNLADAVIVGAVVDRQEGISGNAFTDQAASFDDAYLVVPPLESFSMPAGFSTELWLKSNQNVQNYHIVLSSTSYEAGIAQGYVVMLNPCNQIEFWIATGEIVSQSSADSSGSALVPGCELISHISECSSSCTEQLTIAESTGLPQGVWHVIRSEQFDWMEWAHVYFEWTVTADHSDLYDEWSNEDCTIDNTCGGTQTLSVNGMSITASTNFLHARNVPVEIGGSSNTGSNTLGTNVSPFNGKIDEIAFYSRPLSQSDVDSRVFYGSSNEQPVWIFVEGVDGIGTGAVPNVEYPPQNVAFVNEIVLDWDNVQNGDYILNSSTALRFEWNG